MLAFCEHLFCYVFDILLTSKGTACRVPTQPSGWFMLAHALFERGLRERKTRSIIAKSDNASKKQALCL